MTTKSISSQSITPASFGPDTRISTEQIADFYAILFMLTLMVMIFLFIKKYWVAWLVATVTTPFAGITFLALYYDPLALYLLFFLPMIMIGTSIASAIVGLIMYLWRLYHESKNN